MSNLISKKREAELLSSSFTLSDMEIFIFPELFYPLVIANIMSPILWEWAQDKWFKNIAKRSFNYKINRIKQYIMDNVVFNLDLETWGLTHKETEINRFKDFIDMDALKNSNALFGYEGDKYYFDIDIRRHFGLDKYNTDIIPYWKTETLEAMVAFKNKDGYTTGAGECVSLVALYAAALFVIGKIPLDKIFIYATPLHSQGFIVEGDGFITNNRRLVTKNMWYNGTELSTKARRAVENEKITIVSNLSGYIHTYYNDATINKEDYKLFKDKFTSFLTTSLTFEMFVNFLRTKPDHWDCFQYQIEHNGKKCYISFSTIYKYELASKNKFATNSQDALINDMEAQDFNLMPDKHKILLNLFEQYLNENPNDSFNEIKNKFYDMYMTEHCPKMDKLFDEIANFLTIDPRLPSSNKNFVKDVELDINTEMSRTDIINYINEKSAESNTAHLARYVYRDMDYINWDYFAKAAFERNPVSREALKGKSEEEIRKIILELPNKSIYSDGRLALPDEVWTFGRGNGLEKIFLLQNVLQ